MCVSAFESMNGRPEMDSLVGEVVNARKISDKLFVIKLAIRDVPPVLLPFCKPTSSVLWVEVRIPTSRQSGVMSQTKAVLDILKQGDRIRATGNCTWGKLVELADGKTIFTNQIWSEMIEILERKDTVPRIQMN